MAAASVLYPTYISLSLSLSLSYTDSCAHSHMQNLYLPRNPAVHEITFKMDE